MTADLGELWGRDLVVEFHQARLGLVASLAGRVEQVFKAVNGTLVLLVDGDQHSPAFELCHVVLRAGDLALELPPCAVRFLNPWDWYGSGLDEGRELGEEYDGKSILVAERFWWSLESASALDEVLS